MQTNLPEIKGAKTAKGTLMTRSASQATSLLKSSYSMVKMHNLQIKEKQKESAFYSTDIG